jgi:hypothetical protein
MTASAPRAWGTPVLFDRLDFRDRLSPTTQSLGVRERGFPRLSPTRVGNTTGTATATAIMNASAPHAWGTLFL